MADKSFILRMEIENGQAVVRQIEDLGAAGERAGRKIKQAVDGEATPGLRGFNAAVFEGGRALDGFAMRAGPVGRILSEMGRGGYAAALAVGATVTGVVLLAGQVKSAVRDMDQLADAAERLKINAETLQALRIGARDSGFEPGQADQSVQSLRDARLSALSGLRGSEKSLKAFEALGISRADLVQLESMEALLARVAAGAKAMGDEGRAAGVLFKLGLDAIATALIRSNGDLAAFTAALKANGQVIDEELVKKGAEVNQRWDEMATKLNVAVTPALVRLGEVATPVLEFFANSLAMIANGLTSMQGALEIVAPTLAATARELAVIDGLVARLPFAAAAGQVGAAAAARVAAEAEAEAEARRRGWGAVGAQFAGETVEVVGRRGVRAAAAQADRDLAAARKLVLSLSGQEVQVNARLQETLEGLAKARRLGVIASDAEYQSLVRNAEAKARQELSGQADSLDAAARAAGQYAEQLAGIDSAADGAALRLSAMDRILRGQVTTLNDLLSVLADVIAEMARMAAQQAISGQGDFFGNFASMIGGFFGGGGSAGQSGGVGPGVSTGQFGGRRAAGGPVDPFKAYLVGERGPELVTFGGHGYVHNAGHTAAMMAGQQRQAAMAVNVAPAQVEFKVINQGPPMEVETRQSRGADGRLQAEAILRPIVSDIQKSNIASGRTDSALKGRFGQRPLLTRR